VVTAENAAHIQHVTHRVHAVFSDCVTQLQDFSRGSCLFCIGNSFAIPCSLPASSATPYNCRCHWAL